MKTWTRYIPTNNTKHGIGLKGMKLESDSIRHEVTKELKRGKSHSEETAKLVNETIAKNEKPYKRVPCTIIYKTKKKI